MRKKFVWVFIILICFLIIFVVANPEIRKNIGDKFNSIFSSNKTMEYNDSQINQCLINFNSCREVATTKYSSLSIKILKVGKFENNETAMEFFNAWASPSQKLTNPLENVWEKMDYHPYGEVEYPIVLIATRMKYELETPVVAICNANGELNSFTKSTFLC